MTNPPSPVNSVAELCERLDQLILSAEGIADPESDTFMRGFAYGRFTEMDSELARHWGVGRGRPVENGENLLAFLAHQATEIERLREALEKIANADPMFMNCSNPFGALKGIARAALSTPSGGRNDLA